MISLILSPYAHIVENRLIAGNIHYGIFHQLSGEVYDLNQTILTLLGNLKMVRRVWIDPEELKLRTDPASVQVKQLIAKEFLIEEGSDPLVSFADQYVVRPIQNPAIAWRAEDGIVWLVRTSMASHVFSPHKDELPAVIEEPLPPVAAAIFLQADGTKTLRQIFAELEPSDGDLFSDSNFREAVNFLTHRETQLIKFTSRREDLADPFKPCNIVPRNLYHSAKWNPSTTAGSSAAADFHLHGIEDAWWEFDLIEPTINHSFRFPSEALGGLDYGGRFCCSALNSEVLPRLNKLNRMNMLEVGGGTGTFARSFIKQAASLAAASAKAIDITYQIMELSPTLIQSQKEVLADLFPVRHFQQDATQFHLPGHKFDLIIANEVVADFPIASVHRAAVVTAPHSSNEPSQTWEGEGAGDIEKYDLPVDDAPDSFLINSGVFRFIERAWEHLAPGGALIISEYGGEHQYPIKEYQLNHDEFSIHFGHVAVCARSVGFRSRLISLKEFLEVNDQVLMLDGREEQILCLNSIFQRHGLSLPYAAISQREFQEKFQHLLERVGLIGITFSPLSSGFHYGPDLNEFFVLILQKPEQEVAGGD